MHKFFYAWASFILGRKEFGMSLFIEIFLIGVGLSMDAFAVSICKGLSMKKVKKRDVFIIALFFGGFQALMPFTGWFLGRGFESYITSIDHWIAFILLGIIGGKMLIDGIKAEDDEEEGEFKLDLKEFSCRNYFCLFELSNCGMHEYYWLYNFCYFFYWCLYW